MVGHSASFVVANGVDLDDPAAAVSDGPAARILFLRSPRFLSVTVEPGSLGAALVGALRHDPSLRLKVSGHVRLAEAFNDHDTQIDELGAEMSETKIGAALRSCVLNIAPAAVLDDDGFADLSWLEAAKHGIATAIECRIAEALGLVDGRTCIMVDEGGWTRALTKCLQDPHSLAAIGERARSHARTTRDTAARADQLAGALAALAVPRDRVTGQAHHGSNS